MTLGQLLEEGASRLSQKGIEEALLDARYLGKRFVPEHSKRPEV